MQNEENDPERVKLLIKAIRGGRSDAFAEHNAALTIDYIKQVHERGIINAEQLEALVIAVNDAADSWYPKLNKGGQLLQGSRFIPCCVQGRRGDGLYRADLRCPT
ncbi:hypothetical protein [Pseudomonas sp. CFBP 8772]|uniref:hypothetical protein n=1 Tax=Pseudomonas sp. CFBP 8772 TaxID=2775284 RepID=UPI001786BFE0|nr:hypothetical protein [Pseudomonas sp. CFBP 8772]MBD8598985.1 hypothetical protein [Pseudomonas sp. CFBP 8772]